MRLRGTLLPLVLAACGYNEPSLKDADTVAVDAPPVFDDAGHEIRTIIFDSAENWNDPGADMVDISVDPWGSLTETGYFYGGLLGHGTTSILWDAFNNPSWDKTAGAPVAGIGLWSGADINGSDVSNFGVNGGGTFSIWFEGEIFLAGGNNNIRIAADGVAFVDIAAPHTHAYQRVATGALGGGQTRTYNAAQGAGFYPVRIGWSRGLSYNLSLQIGTGSTRAVKRSELRARGDQARGLLRSVFDNQLLGDDHAMPQVDPNNAINTSFGNPPPGAPGDNQNWSARFSGQFYVVQPGSYTFHADTDDGNVLMVAGQTASPSHWGYNDGSGSAQSDVTTNLAQGWHDLVLDYNQVMFNRKVSLTITDGPELVGQTLPNARLRPVESRVQRIAPNADRGSHTITDNSTSGAGVSSVPLDGAATEALTQLDVLVHFTTPRADDLVFVLKNPSGASRTLANHPSGLPTGDQFLHFTVTDPNFLATTVAGSWTLTVTDNVNGGGGDSTLEGFFITAHTTGGDDQIARSGTWIWTGDLVTTLFSVDDIRWIERLPDGGTPAEIRMRTCTMPGCADNPQWSGPIAQHTPPNLAQERYIQVMVVLASDGTHETELESLIIDYRRNR